MNDPLFLSIFGLATLLNLAVVVAVLCWLSKRQQKLTATFGEFAEAQSCTLEPGGLLNSPRYISSIITALSRSMSIPVAASIPPTTCNCLPTGQTAN